MVGVVFVRRLREGKTYADFRAAWYPDSGFGVPARVLGGQGITDARQVVTVGFVDADVDDLDDLGGRLASQEAERHQRIAEVVESTEVRAFFVVDDDADFTDAPRPVEPAAKGHPWTTGPEPGA